MFRYSMIILPVFLLIAGCCTHGPVEPASITGLYRTTRFILPSAVDEADDVGARGGFVELRLNADRSMQWKQNVPYETGITETELSGTYTISGDTLYLNHSKHWLASEPLTIKDGAIRSTITFLDGPIELVFKKVE